MSNKLREAAMLGRKLYKEAPAHVQKRQQSFIMGLLSEEWLVEHPTDEDESITEEWLRNVGFMAHSLRMSMLLPPTDDWDAIVELSLAQFGDDDWLCNLTQGVPDDHHVSDDHVLITSKTFSTRGDVRRLCAALGIELKEKQ